MHLWEIQRYEIRDNARDIKKYVKCTKYMFFTILDV